MATVYAVMRDDVFVENTFGTSEEAESYIEKLKGFYTSSFSVRKATTKHIKQFIELLTLEPAEVQ